MSVGKRRRKAAERVARDRELSRNRKLSARFKNCLNCGEPGPHFAPPSFGDPGFFTCEKKEVCCCGREGCDGTGPPPEHWFKEERDHDS